MVVVRLAMKMPSWSEALKFATWFLSVFSSCTLMYTIFGKEGHVPIGACRYNMARLSIGAQVHQSPQSERETGRSASQQQLVRFVAFSGRAMKVESWSEALVRRGSVSESSNCTLTCLHSLRESACRRVSFQDVPDVRNRYIQDGMR